MVGFRTYGGGVQSPKPKSDIQSPECAYGRAGGFAGLGRRPKFYYFFLVVSLIEDWWDLKKWALPTSH